MSGGGNNAIWATQLECVASNGATLLKDVSFLAEPGTISAIMGPSGAGKTTLLNALLHRLPRKYVKNGTISYVRSRKQNGPIVGYVMAHDAFPVAHTVHEILQQSAKLRLSHLTREMQAERVAQTLKDLRLEHCADVLIGDDDDRRGKGRPVVSKGERKRVAVAVEMLGSPHILCLDEPTTGIDSRLAFELVETLQYLAKTKGLTVVLTVHQPGERMMALFDSICVLSNGRLLYSGSPNEARGYFEDSCNVVVPDDVAVGDFLLEIATIEKPGAIGKMRFVSTREDLETYIKKFRSSPTHHRIIARMNQWSTKPTIKNYPTQLGDEEIEPSTGEARSNNLLDIVEPLDLKRKSPNWLCKILVSIQRAWLSRVRRKNLLFWTFVTSVLQAVIFGSLFFRIAGDVDEITTKPLDKWPIWDSDLIKYFSDGLLVSEPTNETCSTVERVSKHDSHQSWGRNLMDEGEATVHVDPLLEMLRFGVNEDTGASFLLDLVDNWDQSSRYLLDISICTRVLVADKLSEYPQWQFGDLPDNLAGKKHYDESDPPKLTELTSEQIMSGLIAALQTFDLAVNYPYLMPSIEATGQSLIGFWLPATFRTTWIASPLVCCLGHSTGFNIFSKKNNNCGSLYADQIAGFPTFPRKYFIDYMEQRMNTTKYNGKSAIGGRQLTPVNTRNARNSDCSPKNEIGHQRKYLVGKFLQNFQASESDVRRLLGTIESRMEPGEKQKKATVRGFGSLFQGMIDTAILKQPKLQPLFNQLASTRKTIEGCENKHCKLIQNTVQTLSIFAQDNLTTLLGILNLSGCFLFLLVNVGVLTYDVLNLLVKNRVFYNREKHLKLMSPTPYLVGNMIVDQIFQIPMACLWAAIFLFMVLGTVDSWLNFGLVLILTSFAIYSLIYLVATTVQDSGTGALLATSITAVMLMSTGLFVPDSSLPSWCAWTRFFSIYRYGYRAVALSLFPRNGSYGTLPNGLALSVLGLPPNVTIFQCSMSLLALSLFYRSLAVIVLHCVRKTQGLQS